VVIQSVPRPGAAELRVRDSRDEILRAAADLFATRGFHETSMAEVARSAKVSKALIFWHFKNKEELFVAVLGKLLQPYVIDFAEESGAFDEKTQLLKLIESYLRFVRENVNSIRFLVAQILRDERGQDSLSTQVLSLFEGYRALITDLIGRAQAKGMCACNFPPSEAASFLLAALNGLLIGHLFLGSGTSDLDTERKMLEQWLFGDAREFVHSRIHPSG
jgi:TetR/AcrR family acrAB operon transcriptional repressor